MWGHVTSGNVRSMRPWAEADQKRPMFHVKHRGIYPPSRESGRRAVPGEYPPSRAASFMARSPSPFSPLSSVLREFHQGLQDFPEVATGRFHGHWPQRRVGDPGRHVDFQHLHVAFI